MASERAKSLFIHGGRFKKLPMGRKEDGNN
jgi:hypothetical protein